MITSRGWWFLIIALAVLALGVLAPRVPLTLLALTPLLWFIGEWLLFSFRARVVVRALRVERTVRDQRGPVDTLWAGRTFEVAVALHAQGRWGLPYVRAADLIPFGAEFAGG